MGGEAASPPGRGAPSVGRSASAGSRVGREGSGVSSSVSARARPTPRARCSEQRLKHRDSWNTSEIKIEELFAAYDRDRSGFLEQEEFRELLRDFNQGHAPSDQEVTLMLRLADMNNDGTISQGELHHALRAWHSYRTMDDSVLRLFSEFDVDESGRLDFQELKDMLTILNGDVPISLSEVQWVLDVGDVNGDGRLDRSELLGAVAAWYVHVDRRGSDMTELIREAVTRTAQDSNHSEVLKAGSHHLAKAAAMVRGAGGYLEVNTSATAAGSPSSDASGLSRGGTDFMAAWRQQGPPESWPDVSPGAVPSSQALSANTAVTAAGAPDGGGGHPRCRKLLLFLASAFGKFCYVFFPFLFGALLAIIGWESRDSVCPRNLDGILMWFGVLAIAFGVSVYIDGFRWARDLRIALATILLLLNGVGWAWSYDGRVQLHRDECGHKLVLWSMLVWPTVPIMLAAFGLYKCVTYLQHLRSHDERLQKEVLV